MSHQATNSRVVQRLPSIGVICHVNKPTVEECVELAQAAEKGGAGFCLFPDALGWRDVWITCAAVAAGTHRINIGPGVTNPLTRHPYITLAALASLDEMSGGRTLLGLGAGGSELSIYADIDRRGVPKRTRELVSLLRQAASGNPPLPMAAPVPDVPVIGAARSPGMIAAVGDVCDAGLVWGQTHQIMKETADEIESRGAQIAWAPLRRSDGEDVYETLVYAVLNSPSPVRHELGVDEELEQSIRAALAAGGMEHAARLIPRSAGDVFLTDDDISQAANNARALNATSIVVPVFRLEGLRDRLKWAKQVMELAANS